MDTIAADWLKVGEAAALVRRDEQTVRRWAADGKVRRRQLGRAAEYFRLDLLAVIGAGPAPDAALQQAQEEIDRLSRDRDLAFEEVRRRQKKLDDLLARKQRIISQERDARLELEHQLNAAAHERLATLERLDALARSEAVARADADMCIRESDEAVAALKSREQDVQWLQQQLDALGHERSGAAEAETADQMSHATLRQEATMLRANLAATEAELRTLRVEREQSQAVRQRYDELAREHQRMLLESYRAYERQSDFAAARQVADQLVVHHQRWNGRNHPFVGISIVLVARSVCQLGDVMGARHLAEEAGAILAHAQGVGTNSQQFQQLQQYLMDLDRLIMQTEPRAAGSP